MLSRPPQLPDGPRRKAVPLTPVIESEQWHASPSTHLAALGILLGGMYEFWRTGRVTGLELLLGPDSGGI
jgi:hypothetical protein